MAVNHYQTNATKNSSGGGNNTSTTSSVDQSNNCGARQVNISVIAKGDSSNGVIDANKVDTSAQKEDQSRIKAAKAVIYKVVRVYESVPSSTMKYILIGSFLLLCIGVFSLAVAQHHQETKAQSKYGLAFSLSDAASITADKSSDSSSSVPGEGLNAGETVSTTTVDPPTTTLVPTSAGDEGSITVTVIPDEKNKDDADRDGPTIVIASGSNSDNSDDKSSSESSADDESGNNGLEEQNNPRIVFIERLMGLHVTAPGGEKGDKDAPFGDADGTGQSIGGGSKSPLDKINAKWASRLRKFSIPIMSPDQQRESMSTSSLPSSSSSSSFEPPNPLLRYAAAAMMTRLLAAAARAQVQHQRPMMMAKDKDDDADGEEDTVPILLATMRNDRGPLGPSGPERPIPPMYGRPMPRGPIEQQSNYQSAAASIYAQRLQQIQQQQQQQQMIASSAPISVQHRVMYEPESQKRPSIMIQQMANQQRALMAATLAQRLQQQPTPIAPVMVLLHIPQQVAESRMGLINVASPPQPSPYVPMMPFVHHSPPVVAPIYPQVPYAFRMASQASHAYPFYPMQQQRQVPLQVIPIDASPQVYHRPQQSVNHFAQQRASPMQGSYSHIRPIIEVPVEIPVPVHVPIVVHQQQYMNHYQPQQHSSPFYPYLAHHDQHNDQETSASEQHDQVAIVYYDPDGHESSEGGHVDQMEASAAETNDQPTYERLPPGSPKGDHFLARPLPKIQSPNKMKLWREMVGAKHASQPGVKYQTVSFVDRNEKQSRQHQQQQQQQQQNLGQHEPALVIFADTVNDGVNQQN